MLHSQLCPALISALVFLQQTKSPATFYVNMKVVEVVKVVRPSDPSTPPHSREERSVAWQQLLWVLMGYNYIGIVSFLHNHQYPTDSNTFYQENYSSASMETEREKRLHHGPLPLPFLHYLSRHFIPRKVFFASTLFALKLFVIPTFPVPSFLLKSS